MANKLGEAPVVHEWSAEEKESMVQSYSCHLVAERATLSKSKIKLYPLTLCKFSIDSRVRFILTCVGGKE